MAGTPAYNYRYGSGHRPVPKSPQWDGFCSCCKRPLCIAFAEDSLESEELVAKRSRKSQSVTKGRYAYVCALWGDQPQDALGAMVLGFSLRKAECRHDMVLLHTFDVPELSLEYLRKIGWQTRPVRYVNATSALFSNPGNRFASVFTKLRALQLVEYSKILMMDSDLLVRQNIDELFDMPAPAAMARGAFNGYKHGEPIDGSVFFAGRSGFSPWGQGHGINAGVMLPKA